MRHCEATKPPPSKPALTLQEGLRQLANPPLQDSPPHWRKLCLQTRGGVNNLSYRELFNNIMHYGEFDRMPAIHWGGWGETCERWYGEGLPRDADQVAFFGADYMPAGLPINLGLLPAFEWKTLEETDSWAIVQQDDGVIAQHFKGKSSIPRYIDYTLKDRASWEDFKARLQPDPARIAPNIDEVIEQLKALDRPISVNTGSMVGFFRNWMGVENLAYICADDPTLLPEMCDFYSDTICWVLDQVLPKIKVDLGWGWEDICFRSGPLVSPKMFKQAAVPGYRKISDKLRAYGCDLHLIDCDGKIDDLVPLWLEGGVNVMFPIEIGVWNADPAAFRKQYGKELRIIGGINKFVLGQGPEAIDAELELRKPLMAEGGFIPLPDHLITPETPLDNVKYYIEAVRKMRF